MAPTLNQCDNFLRELIIASLDKVKREFFRILSEYTGVITVCIYFMTETREVKCS